MSIYNLWIKWKVYLLVPVPQYLWASLLARLGMFCSLLPEKGKGTYFHAVVWEWELEKKENTMKPTSFYHPTASSELSAERPGPHTEKVAEHRLSFSQHGYAAETQSYQESEDAQSSAPGLLEMLGHSSASSFVGSLCWGYSLRGTSHCHLAASA